MASLSFDVTRNGKLALTGYTLHPGDEIELSATSVDTLVCISRDSVFGSDRFEIPAGETVTLTVKEDAEEGRFDWSINTRDGLDAPCDFRDEGGSGSVAGRRGG